MNESTRTDNLNTEPERRIIWTPPSEEEKRKGRKQFALILSASIALSLILAAFNVYAAYITSDLTIQIDSKIAPCRTRLDTVGEVLKDVGFKVGEHDIVEPALSAHVDDSTEIRVKRVRIEEEQEREKTGFETIEEDDPEMNRGESKVTQEGAQGEDLVTYRVTYTSDVETAREEIGRKTLKKPVDEIVHVGIRETINGFAYTRKEVFEATAYTGGGRTASGTRARVGEIAVDPRVIPLGTTVYVEGFGELRAEDTGGAVKGHIIDIYMSSRSQCRKWGRRNVTVYLP